MKIEIWSDIACPFCYIGKAHLEKALATLPFGDSVELIWKSYQLNPSYINKDKESCFEYLAREKGLSVERAEQMTEGVANMAKNAGLHIDFSKNIPANTFNAHRLIQLAKTKGVQSEAEELLFKAHFSEGKDIANEEVLLQVAEGLNIANDEVKSMLEGTEFAEAVKKDVMQAQLIGVQGVPFFLLADKYTFSGAQPVEVFKQALVQAYTETEDF